jgi:competence protein ComEC
VLITIVGIYITSLKSGKDESVANIGIKKTYLASIVSNPSETNKAVKAIVLATEFDADSLHNNIPQKVLCYFTKDSLSINLKYGDIITFNSTLTFTSGPSNPKEFDFREYLKQNGINYTSYVVGSDWRLIGYEPANQIIATAGKLRSRILELLRQNGLSGDNYAVAAAVLLGYDDSMENDLKQDYIMAGAMHILCVSGLHVGIIYLVINFLLGFLRNNRTNNILKAILLLLTVWAYATITGLSPSVQRASLMISVFIIGNLLVRNRDTYNTLAISALILLLINPYLIFNVGFQLSYAAVIGIITFHQPIYKLIYIKNTVVDKIWSISVLSFAAQLATFPIATYYFHFFPPWFWLTNLFTFPLSFLIIATGLVFVSTLWIPLIPKLVGWLLSGMIYVLNYVVGMVKYLPLSGIDYIYTSFPMIIVLYLLMLFIFIMLRKKIPAMLFPVIVVIGMIIGLVTHQQYNVLTQKKVIIYSINKHSAWDFIDGKQHVLIADSSLVNETSKLDYHLKNSRTQWGIDNNSHLLPDNDTIINDLLYATSNFLLFNDLRIFINDGSEQYYATKSKLPLNLVIISGRESTKIEDLLTVFDFNHVIIDSSVPYWDQKKIMEISNKYGINCYNVKKEGAFVFEL